MKRRSKARSEAKSLLGSGFKARRSLLGSGFKAKTSLPGSGSGSGSSHRMNPAQPQKLRDEKKQVKAVQDSPRPHCLAKQGEEKAANPYCECCCGAAGSHYSVTCPYLRWLPWNVDTVGKGFVIMCQFCSAIGDDCWHQRKHAVPLICYRCGIEGHHVNGACSEKNGMEYGRKITLGRRPDPCLLALGTEMDIDMIFKTFDMYDDRESKNSVDCFIIKGLQEIAFMESFAAALVQAMQEQAALVQNVEEQVRQQPRVCCYRLLDWSCLLFCKSEFATASNDAWRRVATAGLLSKLIIFLTCHPCWEVRRMTCDATKTIVSAAPQLTEPLSVEFTNFMSAVAEKLRISKLGETDHSLDAQVPFLPSVEVSAKALITISSVALPAAPSVSTRVLLCAHHPYLVGTTNGDAVWKRLQKYMHARNFDIMSIILADLENLFKSLLGPMLLSSTNQSERQAAVSSLSTLMSIAPEQTYVEFEKHLKNLPYHFSHDTLSENEIREHFAKGDNYREGLHT